MYLTKNILTAYKCTIACFTTFLGQFKLMRILWDSRSISPHMGGIGEASVGWLNAFVECMPERWKLTVLLSAVCDRACISSLLPIIEQRAAVCLVNAGMVAPEFEQLQLPALLRDLRADLYFNTCFTVPAIKTTRFQCSMIHDVVFIDHPEWVDTRLARYLRHGTRLSVHCADAVFTVSEYSRQRILDVGARLGWPTREDLRVVLPAVLENLRSSARQRRQKPDGERPYLLYLGSLEQKKGIDVLLSAYEILLREGGCPPLVLAGGGGGQTYDIESELLRRNLASSVTRLGRVSEEQKYQLLANATLFVFPSLYEGFGTPPLEAMTFGIPVIASNTASMPEILGDAALFARAGDPQDLAQVMSEALRSPELLKTLSAAGMARAATYEWKHGVKALIKRFEELESAA